jgi:hemerythrin-like domain-containing protein
VHALAREFLGFYRRHIAMEEVRFFPAALAALSQQDWQEIEGQLVARDDPLFGGRPDRRFERLRQDILAWEEADAEGP